MADIDTFYSALGVQPRVQP